jgi:V/A-type H+-transporting ATPase subunit A
LREDFLQQNAFDDVDTMTSTSKMYLMLKAMLSFHAEAIATLAANTELEAEQVLAIDIRSQIARLKDTPEDQIASIEELIKSIPEQFAALRSTAPAADIIGVGAIVNGLEGKQ